MDDTIAAICTPIGEGAIAIVRMSGPEALAIADRLFVSSHGKPSTFRSHTLHFGTIGLNGEHLDQVMLAIMRAPHSYTTEDVVEINCHGGLLTARNILSLCLQHGARLAQPGEFTKRAFLNGRIDLAQAEAVMDLIGAKTDRAHRAAVQVLEGHLSAKINDAREKLIAVLAHIEAQLDFPEEDIAPHTVSKLAGQTDSIIQLLQSLLATAREGKILRSGISVAIVGRPNVGKSTLMNALLGQDRSIVTPIPGTTRDTIEETANIRGIPVCLTDTAGLRTPRGQVEALGVTRSRKALHTSDIAIHVLDGSRPFSRADRELSELCNGKITIVVVNKVDLPRRLKFPPDFAHVRPIEVCAKTGAGMDRLKDAIEQAAWQGPVTSQGLGIVINERHAEALGRALDSLTAAHQLMLGANGLEVVAQEMRLALNAIGEVVGKTTTDDILDRVFSTFCIGK